MSLPNIGSGLPEIALRTAIIYVVMVVLLRVAGKREVGQMSILDLVVLLIISNGVQNAMVGDNTTVYGGIVAAATLVSLDWGIRRLTDRSRRAERLLEGEPALLVHDGRLMTAAMRRQGISHEELMAALRSHGLERPADAHLVVLETSGHISVIPRDAIKPPIRPPGIG
jgi:uncharacterized membrane protein YcaP (DUF421 family)